MAFKNEPSFVMTLNPVRSCGGSGGTSLSNSSSRCVSVSFLELSPELPVSLPDVGFFSFSDSFPESLPGPFPDFFPPFPPPLPLPPPPFFWWSVL